MNTTSVSLLVRLQRSDDGEAWSRFTQLYTPLLFYWGKRVGLTSSDSEDLVQEVLLVVFAKIPTFKRRGPGTFRAWLRKVTVNKCRERLRRHVTAAQGGNAPQVESLVAAAESDRFWEADYRQHLVARALTVMQSEFETATWQACWQRVVEERPSKEVARSLGLTEGAVYVYTGRVLRRLREELTGLLD